MLGMLVALQWGAQSYFWSGTQEQTRFEILPAVSCLEDQNNAKCFCQRRSGKTKQGTELIEKGNVEQGAHSTDHNFKFGSLSANTRYFQLQIEQIETSTKY
jgi:hypothetical protein